MLKGTHFTVSCRVPVLPNFKYNDSYTISYILCDTIIYRIESD